MRPTASPAVLKLAVLTPPVVVSVPWPMLVAPSEKLTTPVGFAAVVLPGLVTLTVAVKVTLCPNTVVPADATAVLVLAFPTVWLTVLLLPANVPSPP